MKKGVEKRWLVIVATATELYYTQLQNYKTTTEFCYVAQASFELSILLSQLGLQACTTMPTLCFYLPHKCTQKRS
jgi:hypothetical protein